MKTYSFQAPEEMGQKLELLAKLVDRSKGYLIREALREMLDDLEDYIDVIKYKNSREYNSAENLSLKEMKEKYDLK